MSDPFTLYQQFVDGVTSSDSKNFESFIARLNELNTQLDVPRFITSGIGLASESGEIAEIVKKVIFHGKEYNEDVKIHLKKELGDVFWYFTQMCIVLNISLDDIMSTNVKKLESRYPGGVFSAWHSDNRKVGDI